MKKTLNPVNTFRMMVEARRIGITDQNFRDLREGILAYPSDGMRKALADGFNEMCAALRRPDTIKLAA